MILVAGWVQGEVNIMKKGRYNGFKSEYPFRFPDDGFQQFIVDVSNGRNDDIIYCVGCQSDWDRYGFRMS